MISWVIGILVAFVIVGRFIQRRRLTMRTPYQDIADAVERRERRGKPAGKVYDFFTSYKSDDATIVRHVAEYLIAEGFKVWFAEYTILLSERGRFQEFINRGIRQSRFGLCFTNDRYASSSHCRTEIEQLLDPTICGPGNLVEIRLPSEPLTRAKYPQLLASPSVEFASVSQVIRNIQEMTGVPINLFAKPDPSKEVRQEFPCADNCYSIDLGGWDVEDRSLEPVNGGGIRGPKFTRSYGADEAMGHLIIGQQDISRQSVKSGTFTDDRAYYDNALNFADSFYRKVWKQTCVGVHIVFMQDFSHIALTTIFQPGVWSRVYSVVVPEPGSGVDIEFAFFFFFRGNFRGFCRHAYEMDRLVQSLKWR